jgi:hypothetical protein
MKSKCYISFRVELETLRDDQAAYIGVEVAGPSIQTRVLQILGSHCEERSNLTIIFKTLAAMRGFFILRSPYGRAICSSYFVPTKNRLHNKRMPLLSSRIKYNYGATKI